MDTNGVQAKTFACVSCTRRKVRCDKIQPICSTCTRLRLDCQYQEAVPKKRKRDGDFDRLVQYERMLKNHGLLSEESSAPVAAAIPADGKLIAKSGNHRYVESTLWQSFPTPEDIEPDDDLSQSPSTLYSSAILGYPTTPRDVTSSHPPSAISAKLWSVFKDRVEPILKVLHVPTINKMMSQSSFNRNEECLVFAIYFFAASTLTEEECLEMLQQDRSSLLPLYHDTLNQALLNADFLRTTNVQVMQALILMLTVTRGRTDAQLFYILVGVAVRIAQRMGLHRDGTITGLNPYDTEINRRLFWQIPPLDGFAGQFAGTGPGIDSLKGDTKFALNINDADIWPGMTEPPADRKGATEMIFHLVKATFVGFYKDFMSDAKALERNPRDTEVMARANKRIDDIEEVLETKYLRYCDALEPLHLCAALMARGAVQCVRFRLLKPLAKVDMSDEARRDLHAMGLQILDRYIQVQNNPVLKKYTIHTSAFIIWDIVVFSVNHLMHSMSEEQEAIWSRLAPLYQAQSHLLQSKLPIANAIVRHILKAWDATCGSKPTPDYITNMRAIIAVRTPMKEIAIDPQITDDVNSFDWDFWDALIKHPDTLAVDPL